MKQFIMLFRSNYNPDTQYSPEEMQALLKKWQDWMAGLAAGGNLADKGNRISPEGKTLHADGDTTEGPRREIREIVTGYILVSAATLDAAMELAKGCPILLIGGNVEVRALVQM